MLIAIRIRSQPFVAGKGDKASNADYRFGPLEKDYMNTKSFCKRTCRTQRLLRQILPTLIQESFLLDLLFTFGQSKHAVTCITFHESNSKSIR